MPVIILSSFLIPIPNIFNKSSNNWNFPSPIKYDFPSRESTSGGRFIGSDYSI